MASTESKFLLCLSFALLICELMASCNQRVLSAKCHTIDESLIHINTCELKDYDNVPSFNLEGTFKDTIKTASMKASGTTASGPPIVLTFDVCGYLGGKGGSGLGKIFFDEFAQFSNLNHPCPYKGTVSVKRAHPTCSLLTQFVPSGKHHVEVEWTLNNKLALKIEAEIQIG